MCLCVCTYVLGALGGQKRTPDHTELELQAVCELPHLSAGNSAWCSELLTHSSPTTKQLTVSGKEQSNTLGSGLLHSPSAVPTPAGARKLLFPPVLSLPLHFYRNYHPPISRLAGSNNLLISLPVFWVSPFQSILPAVTRPSILKPSLHHVRFLWKTTLPCWAL